MPGALQSTDKGEGNTRPNPSNQTQEYTPTKIGDETATSSSKAPEAHIIYPDEVYFEDEDAPEEPE